MDPDLTRISNGFFNHVGQTDPSLCVKEHYKEVHLEDMVQHLDQELGIKVLDQEVRGWQERLAGGGRGQELVHRQQHEKEQDEILDLRHSHDTESVSSYSGGMDSPQPAISSEEERAEAGGAAKSRSRRSSFSFPSCSNSPVVPPIAQLKRKIDSQLNGGGKRAKGTSGQAKKKCRVCGVEVSGGQFQKHVVTHKYELWNDAYKGFQNYDCSKCKKVLSSWKDLVTHLATKHGELEVRLAKVGESLGDYEVVGVEESDEERVASLTSSSRQEVLERHQGHLPPAFFDEQEEQEEELAPVEDLLDNSQDSDGDTSNPMVIESCSDSADTEPYGEEPWCSPLGEASPASSPLNVKPRKINRGPRFLSTSSSDSVR